MPASDATVIVPTVVGGRRIERLVESVAGTDGAEVLVVDNGSPHPGIESSLSRFPRAEVIRLQRNVGYSRAVNLAAREAAGDALVLLNDDCVCEPGYVEAIVAALDPAAGVTMAAGVMREAREPSRIDTAGMQLDPTLLVFDFLNGEPVARLDQGVADPIGPSGTAAAFDREAFLAVGGFDESLFAYWEDVDLVLRLRREGGRCALAPGARGIHDHSTTLGSGSAHKDYLMGFGRGYVLRKWDVLSSPARAARALLTDAAICGGQAAIDRNLAGLTGRIRGYRAARRTEAYPQELLADQPPGDSPVRTLRRRARRRRRLREALPGGAPRQGLHTLAIFHAAEATGPLRSLDAELHWLAGAGSLHVVVPRPGAVADAFEGVASITQLDYEPVMLPADLGAVRGLPGRWRREARDFRALIRRERPDLVVIVSSVLPAALIAARRERVPSLVYAAELHRGGEVSSRLRRGVGATLISLTGRGATAVIACSRAVAEQFPAACASKVTVVYPPIAAELAAGDGAGFRRRRGLAAEAPCILAVGNLTPGRGQDVLLRALPAIRSDVTDARLVLVGPTFARPKDLAFEDELRALAEELGVADAVTFAGYEPEMAGAYAAAAVVVNPARTHPETFGRVACEALVAGRPVVATRVGAVPEVLNGVPGAELVSPGDGEALARAIVVTLEDPDAPRRALAGGDRVKERFTPQKSLDAFQRVVGELVPVRSASDARKDHNPPILSAG